jgi:hypothetical protein
MLAPGFILWIIRKDFRIGKVTDNTSEWRRGRSLHRSCKTHTWSVEPSTPSSRQWRLIMPIATNKQSSLVFSIVKATLLAHCEFTACFSLCFLPNVRLA